MKVQTGAVKERDLKRSRVTDDCEVGKPKGKERENSGQGKKWRGLL